MENQPNKPKRYYLEYDGKRYEMSPENTLMYLHSNQPEYDHIYVQFEDNEDGEQMGTYYWRRNTNTFDDMCLNLLQTGCNQILKAEASDFDKEQYRQRFGADPAPTKPVEAHTGLVANIDELVEKYEASKSPLTERRENFARYFGYLLLNGHITAEEFLNGTGDLHI